MLVRGVFLVDNEIEAFERRVVGDSALAQRIVPALNVPNEDS